MQFQRQRDTIITWTDEDQPKDYALSFQESKGAQDTWEIICQIQGKDPNADDYQTNTEGCGNGANEMEEDLPLPTFDNLQHVIDELSSASTDNLARKRRCCHIILQDDSAFLRKLHDIFDKAEDLVNYEALFNIFFIFKYMISLGDSKLIETLISQDFYLDTFGALEYDPELINTAKGKEES